MADPISGDDVRRWRSSATEALAATVATAPDATVPAYPEWTVRDLTVHVVKICMNATLALDSGLMERPQPVLAITREDDPEALGHAVREAMAAADIAIESCLHDAVWTPVGARGASFWGLRLLREAILHRWDAEQAAVTATAPDEAPSLELINHFLDTDVGRAFASGGPRPDGVVEIRSDARTWRVDLGRGRIDVDASTDAAVASISGDAAAVMLWLMRRDGLPGPITIDDHDGSARAFTEMIDGFNRPTG